MSPTWLYIHIGFPENSNILHSSSLRPRIPSCIASRKTLLPFGLCSIYRCYHQFRNPYPSSSYTILKDHSREWVLLLKSSFRWTIAENSMWDPSPRNPPPPLHKCSRRTMRTTTSSSISQGSIVRGLPCLSFSVDSDHPRSYCPPYPDTFRSRRFSICDPETVCQ